MLIEALLWILAALVVYAYAGYPLLLALVSRRRRADVAVTSPAPATVTLIIAAYNEEKGIARKLEQVLALEWPAGARQIIVASDCSTDGTHDIVRRFEEEGVELVVLPAREGKTAAQNLAIAHARGDILVFTDATTRLAPDALVRLIEPFADRRVGCTGAALEYESRAGTAVGRGGGLYWRYERKVKALESRAHSLIGVSGCLYAVRRELYVPIAADLISDLVIALDIYAGGHVTRYVPAAVAFEETHEQADREFAMRTRVIVRSINALVRRARLLNPFATGFFALQLWSHKVARYLVPELLLGVLAATAWLAFSDGPRAALYCVLLAAQAGLYVAVPLVYAACRRLCWRTGPISAPFYFVLANAAAFWAQLSYVRGARSVSWATVR